MYLNKTEIEQITRNTYQRNYESPSNQKEEQNIQANVQEEINWRDLENMLKKFVTYANNKAYSNKYPLQCQRQALKKPPHTSVKFSPFQTKQQKLKKIMQRAYNYEQLKIAQFKQLQEVFKLSKNQVKLMNYPDPVVLQTLRYAIFNTQQIPSQLVNVIIQMAKTNIKKDFQIADFFTHHPVKFNMISEEFEPPLDLYTQFLETGLIEQKVEQLIEIFTRNQFLFLKISQKKQFYESVSQKKRLIFNQFPYMIDIFYRITVKSPESFHIRRLELYLSGIINFLEFPDEDYLFQRYLPEVRCRYLRIKSKLTQSDIQFLFLILKSIDSLTQNEFKILYHTRPKKSPIVKQHRIKSIRKFEKIEQLCTKILIRKDYHLTKQQLQQIGQLINYEKCYSEQLITMNFIFVILKEEAYFNQQFSQSLINNISWVLENIPDKKKRKQSCYMLLLQYFKEISERNSQKRGWFLKQCNFPEFQVDYILDEGRQIALDILISQQENNLIFAQEKNMMYEQIVKLLITTTNNKRIKNQALELDAKLNRVNKYRSQDLKFYEQNLTKSNQSVEILELNAKNGKKMTKSSINNILRILVKNKKPSIRKSCLCTLRYAIRNKNHGQNLPDNFQPTLIQMVMQMYFEAGLPQQIKNEILRLVISCLELTGTYSLIQSLTKFLMNIYRMSLPNSPIQINSSYGIYTIGLSFKLKSGAYCSSAQQFLDVFAYNSFETYKEFFQLNNIGSINILCSIVALSKNQVLLPMELVEQLTVIALQHPDLCDLALMGVLLQVKNRKSKGVLESSMLNICQILKQSNNNQIIGVNIIKNIFRRSGSLPDLVIKKIQWLTRLEKCWNKPCQVLCKFYKTKYKKFLIRELF